MKLAFPYKYTPGQILSFLYTKKEEFWLREGEAHALSLFHETARRVPAYKDFLKKHKVRHETIKTIEDFEKVPQTDKNSSLRAYPLESLCWDGALAKSSKAFAATSGSTGEPFYFPRDEALMVQSSIAPEMFLIQSNDGQ